MKALKRPTQAELDVMSHAEKDALIFLLFDWLAEHENRLAKLEHKIDKNSTNSSKPPSSDGLKKGAAQPRQPGEKTSGGQKGHQGSTRLMVDNPDLIETLLPKLQCDCGAVLALETAVVKERRQQIEIPMPRIITTEYQQMGIRCACGLEHKGQFPSGVTPNVSFGARLKAYSVGLVYGHFISLERTGEILKDQYGIQPSSGTIQKWGIQAAQGLANDYAAHRQAIIQASVGHFDESGMRINGKLNWLHLATTATHVHYSNHEKRGALAMDAAGILPHFKGIAVHDHWKPYWQYQNCTHALCNAHHLRELRYCEELTGQQWPIELRHLLVEGKKAVAAAQAENQTKLPETQVDELLKRYDQQIEIGLKAFPIKPSVEGKKGKTKQDVPTNLLIRLRDFKSEVWRFLTDWQVPFDNNRAERLVRPVKVKLKIIGGFRAVGGANAFCVIRSVWETNKLNHINPFETLRSVFIG